MSEKLLVSIICAVALTGCSSGDWPRANAAPYNWPKSDRDAQVVEQRYDRASSMRLGTRSDVAQIEKVILNDRDHVCTEGKEVRWLSATSVMAKAGSYGGNVGDLVELIHLLPDR